MFALQLGRSSIHADIWVNELWLTGVGKCISCGSHSDTLNKLAKRVHSLWFISFAIQSTIESVASYQMVIRFRSWIVNHLVLCSSRRISGKFLIIKWRLHSLSLSFAVVFVLSLACILEWGCSLFNLLPFHFGFVDKSKWHWIELEFEHCSAAVSVYVCVFSVYNNEIDVLIVR